MTEGRFVPSQSDYQSYLQWDLKSPQFPSRSRLSRLEPIGIGTSLVESLASYISRLAAEHCVSPRRLVFSEGLHLKGKLTSYQRTFPLLSAHRMNGMGSFVESVIKGFEQLTLRDDLRYMTLQLWGNILSNQQLFRNKRAWCAYCYEERSSARQSIYELLLWAFEEVTICIKHLVRLWERCPYCKYQLPFIPTDYHPGYCSRCTKWLGISKPIKPKQEERITEAEISRQFQFQNLIGEILSNSKNVKSPPSYQNFIANLVKLIEQYAYGNINVFSDIVGIWSGTIRRFLASGTRLSLNKLCQICVRLNVTPLDLLADHGNEDDLKRRRIALEDISSLRVITSWSIVEDKLKAALKEHPPPSMETTSRNLGYYPPKIKRHFPELCEQIISRYKEYQRNTRPSPETIQKAFQTALKESPAQSLQMVLRRLGCRDTGSYYYRNYRDLCFKVSKRFKEYHKIPFIFAEARTKLEATFMEEPPPSFSEVVRRLKHNRKFVREKFPALSAAITSRYKHYQTALHKENAERLRDVIREAVRQTTALGFYASEARVKEFLKQHQARIGRDSLFKQALAEVKSEMGLTS